MRRKSEDLAQQVWPEQLQQAQDELSQALGLPLLFVDQMGRPLTACEDLAAFCRQLTRGVGMARPCLECSRGDSAEVAIEAGLGPLPAQALVHVCPLGLLDVAAPIVSAGDLVGYLVSAQVPAEASELPGERESWGREDQECAALAARLPRRTPEELCTAAATLSVVAWLTGALARARQRNLRLSERVREQGRWLQEQVTADAVTGVANRRHLCEVLQKEVLRARRYHRRLSVAVLDIRGFRRINEDFDHDVGDAALRAVARTLAATVRQTDLVARVGADEFALVFPETCLPEAMIALSRVAAQVDDLNASGELPVEVSLGVGLTDDLREDMLAAAYQSLRAGHTLTSLRG